MPRTYRKVTGSLLDPRILEKVPEPYLSILLSIVFRSVIHERPRAVWRPMERNFWSVRQGFYLPLLIAGKLLRTERWWYFDYHALSSRDGALSPKLRHQEKQRTTGRGSGVFP
jgi:hypothetical protein